MVEIINTNNSLLGFVTFKARSWDYIAYFRLSSVAFDTLEQPEKITISCDPETNRLYFINNGEGFKVYKGCKSISATRVCKAIEKLCNINMQDSKFLLQQDEKGFYIDLLGGQ